jgi:ferric-dicitrate binding protein FerR (iron transport regulator)
MAEDYDDIDALIAKHVAGETDATEQARIEQWLAADAANPQYLAGLQRLWEQAAGARPAPERAVDTDAALAKVKSKIRGHFPLRARILRTPFWLRAAAVLVGLAVALWFWPQNAPVAAEIASADATLRDTLADGSVVVLNQHSSLRISEQFGQKERRARLVGEAWFRAAHDAAKPFLVEAGTLEIAVLGTEFNVDYRAEAGRVVVAVGTGKVQMRIGAQREVLLAGEQAECDLAAEKITRRALPDPNVLAYQDRRFTFEGTPLSEVVSQLSKVYNVSISLKNNNLRDCPLTTRFNGLPLEEVLDIIADSFSLHIVRDATGISLDGTSCGSN